MTLMTVAATSVERKMLAEFDRHRRQMTELLKVWFSGRQTCQHKSSQCDCNVDLINFMMIGAVTEGEGHDESR